MAKTDFSFDIVSQVSMPEVANAVDQARREIVQRFDFKNTGTSISQDDKLIELRSSTEDRLKAALEALKENVGIAEEKAKELVKFIKGTHAKVQSQIQGDQVRVTGKSKDDLQVV